MQEQSQTTNKHSHEPALFVEDVSFAYDKHQVLENITFTVDRGNITALIGPNGSGKTTLLKLILGLLETKEGQVTILGNPIGKVRDRVGYVPQRFEFDRYFPITVREFMELAIQRREDRVRVETKISEVGLSSEILNQKLGSLSGGQLQRVLIAQAILNEPDILFLDEPSAGIDIAGEAMFYDILQHLNEKHHTTIFLVSHDVSFISETVNQIICLNKKLMCSGPPKEALSEAQMSELFGSQTGVYKHGHHHN
jgi:ABC-type Mn2+/Zn2+ transport system ATPase subunit